MNAIKITKGPWRVGHLNPCISPSGSFEAKTELITVVATTEVAICGKYGSEEVEANAKLIAAAPDLLESLQMVCDADDDLMKDGGEGMPQLQKLKILAAIKKASI